MSNRELKKEQILRRESIVDEMMCEELKLSKDCNEDLSLYSFCQIEECMQYEEKDYENSLTDIGLESVIREMESLLCLEQGKIKKLVKLVSLQFYGIEISERTNKAFDELLEIQSKARESGFFDEAELTAIFYNYVL